MPAGNLTLIEFVIKTHYFLHGEFAVGILKLT